MARKEINLLIGNNKKSKIIKTKEIEATTDKALNPLILNTPKQVDRSCVWCCFVITLPALSLDSVTEISKNTLL